MWRYGEFDCVGGESAGACDETPYPDDER